MLTFDYLVRNIRPLILVLGFCSGILGTLGSFVFIESLNDNVKELTDRRDAATAEIGKLGSLSADYFIANQQGDLIYALGLQQGARQDVLALIFQGNLLDRAAPMRNIIGEMAIAGLLDYRQTYDEYLRLNELAAAGDFQSYITVKAYEQKIVEQAQQRVAELQVGLVPLNQEITKAEARLRDRHQAMILLSSAGAFLLLLANLVEARRQRSRAEPGPSRGSG